MLIQLTTVIIDGENSLTHAKLTKGRFDGSIFDFCVVVGRIVESEWTPPSRLSIEGVNHRFSVRDADLTSLLSVAMQAGTFGNVFDRGLLQWAIDHGGPQGTIV